MSNFKSFLSTITGSISSVIPMFFTVCKSGVCTMACASPIATILGISSASLIASPLTQSLFPLLLVISSVSFTMSYYNLYVIPKYKASCSSDCACDPPVSSFQQKLPFYIFYVGLILSIVFFTYFEYQTYLSNSKPIQQSTSFIEDKNSTTDSIEVEVPCCSGGQKCETK